MRVKYKWGPVEFVKLGEFNGYWVLHDVPGAGIPFIAIPTDYEPVPEETWRDVTAECDMLKDNVRVWHGEDCVIDPRFGYRLKKIDKDEMFVSPRAAFIIERRA